MKKKTSISIDYDLLEKVGEIAAENERSKAWIIEKLMEILIATAENSQGLSENSQGFGERLKRVADELKKGSPMPKDKVSKGSRGSVAG